MRDLLTWKEKKKKKKKLATKPSDNNKTVNPTGSRGNIRGLIEQLFSAVLTTPAPDGGYESSLDEN